ncbi:MAG: LLM class flavin-dependent oxidoreductase [Actinomycetota bacterium]|nr:LLM class flavin-dependent oxidoreductase [Actinomycetota bacterium]
MAGIIGHVVNPTPEVATQLAVAGEAAGAEWIGLADAFWWRDVWMLLAAVAAGTDRIRIGPAMTNPYLRHPFHTASALATLSELTGDRTMLGIAAGGSEVTHAAHVSRVDAAARTRDLIDVVTRAANSEPLDADSGRSLDLDMPMPRTLIAGRGKAMLAAAGELGDDVLLWAIPRSDLERTVSIVREAAKARSTPPRLIWAPLIDHGSHHRDSMLHVAVYAALNSAPQIRSAWGLEDETVAEIRSALVAGGTAAAKALVPQAALDDLVMSSDIGVLAPIARSLGVEAIATPGFSPETVGEQVSWARDLESRI